jgi:hypothetical protein
MDTFKFALGDELRSARVRRHWTQLELVGRVPFGVSGRTVASWELGTPGWLACVTPERVSSVGSAGPGSDQSNDVVQHAR